MKVLLIIKLQTDLPKLFGGIKVMIFNFLLELVVQVAKELHRLI
jgi:hypothetical protein